MNVNQCSLYKLACIHVRALCTSHRHDIYYKKSLNIYVNAHMCPHLRSHGRFRRGLRFDLGGYSFRVHETTPRTTSTGPSLKLIAYLFLLSLLPLHLLLTASHDLVLRLPHFVQNLVYPCKKCLCACRYICVWCTCIAIPKKFTLNSSAHTF